MKIPNNVKIKRAVRYALKPEEETVMKIHDGNTRFHRTINKGRYGIPGAVILKKIDWFYKRQDSKIAKYFVLEEIVDYER